MPRFKLRHRTPSAIVDGGSSRLTKHSMRLRNGLVALAAFALLAAAPSVPLDWAFPGPGPKAASIPASQTYRLPGARTRFTQAAIADLTHAPDWFPNEHPPAPRSVLAGPGGACGYCHLVNGAGRSENAQLRGQSVRYIEEQVRAFASGARRSAGPDYPPTQYMSAAARAVSPADLHAAAVYFASLEPQRHAQVIEAATIPRASPEGFLYRFDTAAREPLGKRIIEGATDAEHHRLHDPHERSIAYVPVGSLARGAALANHGTADFPACTTCHTAHLTGIGGASPTYIVRQLAGFRARTRNDPGAAPMQAVAEKLSDDQIIDLAAYIGSRPAWTRAQMAKAMAQ
jgi:cytochrome c553